MIDLAKIERSFVDFKNTEPFNHVVIDGFFEEDFALKLAQEFPSYESEVYNGVYNSPLEIKKLCNVWDKFPSSLYKAFNYLVSNEFVNLLQFATQYRLYPDSGLQGGGLHCHPSKGFSNVHLDYSVHSKLNLQRKLNIIVYLNDNYKSEWGGELGLYSHDCENNQPDKLIKSVEPKFNRAIIFDTTQNSWHGLPEPNNFPIGEDRKSIAVYYLTTIDDNTVQRGRALFAPTLAQKNNVEVLELIKRRSEVLGENPDDWKRN